MSIIWNEWCAVNYGCMCATCEHKIKDFKSRPNGCTYDMCLLCEPQDGEFLGAHSCDCYKERE